MTNEYLAGFFDGEGSIGMYWNSGSPDPRYKSGHKSGCWIRSVSVVNTYRPILETFQDRFGGTIGQIVKDEKYKPCFQWSIRSKFGIRSCLETLKPYLIEKREQAILMLLECTDRGDSYAIARRLKELKHAPTLVS